MLAHPSYRASSAAISTYRIKLRSNAKIRNSVILGEMTHEFVLLRMGTGDEPDGWRLAAVGGTG